MSGVQARDPRPWRARPRPHLPRRRHGGGARKRSGSAAQPAPLGTGGGEGGDPGGPRAWSPFALPGSGGMGWGLRHRALLPLRRPRGEAVLPVGPPRRRRGGPFHGGHPAPRCGLPAETPGPSPRGVGPGAGGPRRKLRIQKRHEVFQGHPCFKSPGSHQKACRSAHGLASLPPASGIPAVVLRPRLCGAQRDGGGAPQRALRGHDPAAALGLRPTPGRGGAGALGGRSQPGPLPHLASGTSLRLRFDRYRTYLAEYQENLNAEAPLLFSSLRPWGPPSPLRLWGGSLSSTSVGQIFLVILF